MRSYFYLPLIFPLILGFCTCPGAQKTSPPPRTPTGETTTSATPPPEEKATTKVEPETELSFARDVLPLLKELAGDCHTQDDMAGNYALDSYEAVMAGGTDSTPNVIPGNPENSLLYIYLKKGHPFGKKPTPEQLRIIHDWILQGAKNN
ncbi:MAG: c-type cytochrome domain-containing protein [bacterium]